MRLPTSYNSGVFMTPGQYLVSDRSLVGRFVDTHYLPHDTQQEFQHVSVSKSVSRTVPIVLDCVLRDDPHWWGKSRDSYLIRYDAFYGIQSKRTTGGL